MAAHWRTKRNEKAFVFSPIANSDATEGLAGIFSKVGGKIAKKRLGRMPDCSNAVDTLAIPVEFRWRI